MGHGMERKTRTTKQASAKTARRWVALCAWTLALAWCATDAVWAAAPAVAGEAPPPPTATVEMGLLRIVVRATGVVVAGTEVPLVARATGEVIAAPVKAGQSVKAGQLLMEVERGAYALTVERAEADWLEALARVRMAELRSAKNEKSHKRAVNDAQAALRQAEGSYKEARDEFDRASQSHKGGGADDKALSQARQNREDARSRLEQAKAASEEAQLSTYTLQIERQEIALWQAAVKRTSATLANARAELSTTRLQSPLDGVVTEYSVVRGQVITPTDVQQGRILIVVCDLAKIAVVTEIEESQVRDIQPNLAATVEIPAFPDRVFNGRIVTIGRRGVARNGKVCFPIRIDLETEPGDAGRIGLTANIQIIAIEKPKVLLVDNRAIQRVGNETRVVLYDPKEPKAQVVKLGRSDGVRTEVLEGLREGDKVILP